MPSVGRGARTPRVRVVVILPTPERTRRYAYLTLTTGVCLWHCTQKAAHRTIAGRYCLMTGEFTPIRPSDLEFLRTRYRGGNIRIKEFDPVERAARDKERVARNRAIWSRLSKRYRRKLLCPDGRYRTAFWGNRKGTRIFVKVQRKGVVNRNVAGTIEHGFLFKPVHAKDWEIFDRTLRGKHFRDYWDRYGGRPYERLAAMAKIAAAMEQAA